MANASDTWTVHEHGPLEKLESNLWRVEGSIPKMPLRRVMTIARMSNGALVIHNGIALQEPAMQEIEAFGEMRYLVVPNGYHRIDAPAYKRRYPRLEVVCPKAARQRVEQVVPVAATYDTFAQDRDVQLEHVAGTADGEGVMTVRHGDRTTLVFNDLIFNMPHLSGFQGFVLKYLTASSGGPKVSRVAKLLVIKDRAAVASDLQMLAKTPGLQRIIVSHHQTIDSEPAAVLERMLP